MAFLNGPSQSCLSILSEKKQDRINKTLKIKNRDKFHHCQFTHTLSFKSTFAPADNNNFTTGSHPFWAAHIKDVFSFYQKKKRNDKSDIENKKRHSLHHHHQFAQTLSFKSTFAPADSNNFIIALWLSSRAHIKAVFSSYQKKTR